MRLKRIPKIECEICGEKNKSCLEKHHIVEKTDVNCNDHPMNLAIICSNCHSKVHGGHIKLIGIYPSTKLPYQRTLVYEINGVSNVPGITEPYYIPSAARSKIYVK